MRQSRRRQFLFASGALLVALTAGAQPARKMARVGVLSMTPLSSMNFPRQFPGVLRELGYVEKQNILLEWRTADGKAERLPELAAELVRTKPDVIVAIVNADILAAKRATTVIPIVMVAASDPVGAGLVSNLARPGGNVTGRTFTGPETFSKQIEVLKETVPAVARLVFLRGADIPGLTGAIQGVRAGAKALGLALGEIEVRQTGDASLVLEEIRRWKPDALFTHSSIPAGHRDAILKFAVQQRLPVMSSTRGVTEAGGLMVYAPNDMEVTRRVAWYVDRILKGAKPSDLPVEQPLKYDLVINMKTARAIGLKIPLDVLRRADAIIE